LEVVATHFEGPEKKLEIILFSPQLDIRNNDDGRWDKIVKASRADIISKKSSAHLDAYILSESSLFVWDDRILIITCGKTTLIATVPKILEIVNRENIALVFYERRNLMFPQEQPADFEEDVVGMEQYFPGKSYRLGPANHDHVHVFFSSHAKPVAKQDATLQILMRDFDKSIADLFCRGNTLTKDQLNRLSGLDRIYSKMEKDSHIFSPYGYSLNGIHYKSYFTVHVTPQPEGAYASFETNVIESDYSGVISDVVSVFKPQKFSILLTTSMDEACLNSRSSVVSVLPDYVVTEKSFYEFDCDYSLTFLNYVARL
jgi:S-adenosylmethionine decarboxylase